MAQVLLRQEDIDNLTPNQLNIFKNTLGVDNLTQENIAIYQNLASIIHYCCNKL